MFLIDISEISDNSQSNIPNNDSFLQTSFWCNFKSRHGWTYKRFNVSYTLPMPQEQDCKLNNPNQQESNTLTKNFELAVLNRNFAKGIFSIAYVPLMPDLPYECTKDEDIEQAFSSEDDTALISNQIITPETQAIEFSNLLNELALALKPYLPSNTLTIRFDPHVDFSNLQDRELFNYGIKTVAFADRLRLKKSRVDIQPPDTTIIDLTLSEDELLANMHSKWRYNIRMSQKKGVIVNKYTGDFEQIEQKIDIFYALTKETNARDGNSCHAKSYYLDLIKSSYTENSQAKDSPLVTLYIAEHEGDMLASIMTLFTKNEAVYLYGASSNNKRNLMPNHLLQWTAIKDAKLYGSKCYDMYGIPPTDDDNHPMHGLYLFKTNFGGKIIHRTGTWDVPLKTLYYFFACAESLRAFWHKKVIKKFLGR